MDDKHLEAVVDEGRAEFDATAPERGAIESPSRTTYELVSGVQLVAASVPRILPYKDQLARLPGFDAGLLKRVVVYGRAAFYAIKRERILGAEKSTAHPALVAELDRVYFRFMKTAEYLVAMGHLGDHVLSAARTGTSVGARATALGMLAIEFGHKRESLAANLILGVDEISRASTLSREIIESLGTRTNDARTPTELRHDRQRAAMVFFDAWEEIRRGVHWLRWYEGDAGALAPSLFTTADRRSGDDGDDDEPSDDGANEKRVEKKPTDPLPADKREELERGNSNAGKGVPQNDPF
jgi:hypothetical protein